MSFLLSNCKELTYSELVSLNGGCSQGFFSRITGSIKSTVSGIGQGISNVGSSAITQISTITSGSSKSGGVTTSSSGVCSGSGTCNGAVKYNNGDTTYKTENSTDVANDASKNNRVRYFIQKILNKTDYTQADSFGETACGATSLLNEIAEQYTLETGAVLTEEQVKKALLDAVDAGGLNPKNAFVWDWNKAANAMSESLGLKGTWKYTTDGDKATATIISIDTDTKTGKFDDYHDHFVNDIGNGLYYDPWYNTTGRIEDLKLTSKWKDTDSIKSPYRYLTYEK